MILTLALRIASLFDLKPTELEKTRRIEANQLLLKLQRNSKLPKNLSLGPLN